MSFIGLNSFIIARIDPTTHTVITDEAQGGLTGNMGTQAPGVFSVNLSSAAGATKANISNLQGSVKKTYGSNAVARAAAGTPEPTVALAANNIPFDILAKITGMKSDGKGGYIRDTAPEINHCALLISSTAWNGSERYVGFYDGTVTMGNTNIQTNDASEKIAEDSLTFTALGVDAQVGQSSTLGTSVSGVGVPTAPTGNNVTVYGMWDSSSKGFNYNAMIANVFKQAKAESTVSSPKQ